MECVMWDFEGFGEDGRNQMIEQALNLHSHVDGEGWCSCAQVGTAVLLCSCSVLGLCSGAQLGQWVLLHERVGLSFLLSLFKEYHLQNRNMI